MLPLLVYGGNGDGYMLYPGTPDRIGGKTCVPIESVRLKHVRDGYEDFEYLRLLEATVRSCTSLCAARLLAALFEVEQLQALHGSR